MKKSLLPILSALLPALVWGQGIATSFQVMRLPASAHVAALGGEHISLAADDAPSVGFANPALYAGAASNAVGLQYMTMPAGGSHFGAQYVRAFGDRHTAAVTAACLSYGSMDETDQQGVKSGTFTPKDIQLGVGYSYLLSDLVSGGASLKMVSSSYGSYSSLALAVDLGLNYYDPDLDLSLSAALQNIGRQVKTFDEGGPRQHLPFNAVVGGSFALAHAPVRLTVTMTDLTRWSQKDYFTASGAKLGFGRMLANHFVVGADVVVSESITLSAGYNLRRAYELKQAGESHWAGLSGGATLSLRRFKFGVSYAQYALSSASLGVNAAYVF
ncbi:MAG: type IX secretion system protein PorQ [Bacteroidaceae bacterium]|nr:type IX secretion system protein PorQ [Bacteroidaceae bacterium]